MSTSIILAIIVTSLATFSSRVLGVISSEGIKETSKLFRWFNCWSSYVPKHYALKQVF